MSANGETTTPRPPQIVKFNVGQVPFMMARDTLCAYPDSMLSKLMRSCEEAVENGEYLYVDRDPKSFPWIVEIYRNGCYKTKIPDNMLVEELQKDLDFYRLPSLAELGIQVGRRTDPIGANVTPLSFLYREIMAKLVRCGAIYMLPLDVIVYYECKEGRLGEDGPKILLAPLSESRFVDTTDQEDHEGLVKILREGCSSKDRHTLDWGKKLFARRNKKEYWIIDFSDEVKRQLLNKEADKWDMEVTFKSRPFGKEGKDMTLNVLVVQYRGSTI